MRTQLLMTISSSSTTSILALMAPPPSRALGLDRPAGGPDDPVADRQPESRAFPYLLRSEKGIENPLEVLRRNTASRIDNSHFHHRHGRHAGLGASRLRTAAGGGRGTARVFDCMLGIDEHVHDHLLDQVRVVPYLRSLAGPPTMGLGVGERG